MESPLAEPWQKFVAEFGETPRVSGSVEDTKQQWGRLMGKLMGMYSFPPPDETVATENVDLGDFSVRTYLPEGATGNEPLGIYFHGGGFVMGSVDQEDGFCRVLSRHGRMRVVSVEYRLAPEFKFPRALDDGEHAAIWALNKYSSNGVALMGTSAGGNLAFGVALRLVERGMADSVKGVVALAPMTVHPAAVPDGKRGRYTAYDENDKYTINSKPAMTAWLDAYGSHPRHTYLSVLLHPRLDTLRRVYITECGADTLRDDARLMKESLEEAGVSVMYDAYPGYPHYSWLFPSKHLDQHRKQFFAGMFKGIGPE
ncbi:hypothetical protein VTI74DRAFT_8954 [Chaetomium olivicolor]